MILWFLILFGLLKAFVIEGYEVEGDSMVPTLHDRERILVFKLPHKLSRLRLLHEWEPFNSGDIIVFNSTTEPDKRYVKRVIAFGQRPENGNTVDASQRDPQNAVHVQFERGVVYVNNKRVEENYLPNGSIPCDERQGIDLNPFEYYVLGDNRPISKDSRSFGPVQDTDVIGRALFRFWPLSKFGPL